MHTNEELALMVQQGDREAAGELWYQVRYLLFKMLTRYYPLCPRFGLDSEDLEQEGYFALLRAAWDFDPGKGYQFNSYLSRHVDNVVKEALGLRGHKTRPQNVRSLDEPLPGMDESITLGDTIEDESAAAALERVRDEWQREQFRACLDACMEDMPPDYAYVICTRYYKGKTLQAIADDIGVNREAVRQIEAKVLRHLRTRADPASSGRSLNPPLATATA